MANTETSVTELKINKLTKAQYEGIASPSNTELYFVKDEAIDYNDLANVPNFHPVAFSGDYNDLENRLFLKQADWNQSDSSSIDYIKNKPNLSTVATSGSYSDLLNKPTIPTTTNLLTSGSEEALTSGGAFTNLVSNVVVGNSFNQINVTKNGNVSTITINNVENATTASKLGSNTIGSTTQPIYLLDGVPTQIGYTIAKSVPSNAKFTDTTYSVFTGSDGTSAGTAGLVKAPEVTDNTKFLRGDCTWAEVDAFPSQSGQSGKFLSTTGSTVRWVDVPQEIPSQSGNSGKFLTTNGSAVSWANVPNEIPSQAGNSGKYLTTNGTSVSWSTVDALPAQSGQSGKYLTTDGSNPSWVTITFPTVDQSYNSTSTNAQSGTAVAEAIANKVTKTTGNYQIYGTNGSGVTTSYTMSSGNVASTIVYRTAESQVRVATTPAGNNDATSKKYVDDKISTDYALQIIDY